MPKSSVKKRKRGLDPEENFPPSKTSRKANAPKAKASRRPRQPKSHWTLPAPKTRTAANVIARATNANAKNSPLLRLPAALRNLIHHFLFADQDEGLGRYHVGRIKHIGYRAGELQKNNAKSREAVVGGFQHTMFTGKQNPWMENESVTPSPTQLFQVCRQLFLETAGFSQESVTALSFVNEAVMKRYLIKEGRMSLEERRAIRILYMPRCWVGVASQVRKKFSGLKVVIRQSWTMPDGTCTLVI